MGNQKIGFIRSPQSSASLVSKIIDVSCILTILVLCLEYWNIAIDRDYLQSGIIGAFLFVLIAEPLGVYLSWRTRVYLNLLATTVFSWILACLVMMMIAFFLKIGDQFSRLAIGWWFSSTLIILSVWRVLLMRVLAVARSKGQNLKRVFIVGLNDTGIQLYEQIEKYKELGLTVTGFYDDRQLHRLPEKHGDKLLGLIQDGVELAERGEIDMVFITLALKEQNRITEILVQFGNSTANVYLVPDFFHFNLLNSKWGNIGRVQTLSIYESPFEGVNQLVKRAEDLLLSIAILTIVALPMLVIATLVKLSSKGPVIFKQHRYGLDGQKISVWKFRSMTTCEDGGEVVQATKNDMRVTKLGAILRKTSLDELPQFINVLQGHMSVVGPRPHAVAHNETYRKIVNYYMLRHKVKPGVTGLAQVNGYRGETDTLDKMEKRVEFDLEYIRSWSVWLDVKIVILTVFKGVTGSNVY
jgi:undecaprenyl-phosphate glucose phosphotransferase